MAFDWMAGTALVVGIGSLALTWQSTRAAKRAIDTSIKIYEKQKVDSEIEKIDENNKRLLSIKNITMNEVMSVYMKYIELITILDMAKNGNDFKSITDATKRNMIVVIGGKRAVATSVFFPKFNKITELLFDIYLLDERLGSIVTDLLNSHGVIERVVRELSYIVTFENEDFVRNKVCYLSDSFDIQLKKFNGLLNDAYSYCSSDEMTLTEIFEKVGKEIGWGLSN